MSAKEKSKFEDMAKSDKALLRQGDENYVPPKGDKKERKKILTSEKASVSVF